MRTEAYRRAFARAVRFAVLLGAACAACAQAGAQSKTPTIWEYAKVRDSHTGTDRHTVQTRIDYGDAAAALAFVCARRRLVLTVVATWPISNILRFRFPPESAQWIQGSTPVPSAAVFEGEEVQKLFETVLARHEMMIRIPGPRTVEEKTLDLDGFAEKAKPVMEACGIGKEE